jgi:hypothetical protein
VELTSFDREFGERHPDLLYHYTDAAGLQGILQSGHIWATNVRFLNDTKEGELPFEMALEALKVAYARAPEQTEDMARHIEAEAYYGGGLPIYLASFSSVPDSLSQWRGYGGTTQGYTVAFHRDELLAHARTLNWDLKECVYDENLLRSKVDEVVTRGLREGGGPPTSQLQAVNITNRIHQGLRPFAEHFKHEAFNEEREWRLVGQEPNSLGDEKIKFRVGTRGLVPYVSVPLPRIAMPSPHIKPGEPADTTELSVAAIGVGPGWTANTVLAVDMLCNQARVRLDERVYKSTAPYLPT